MFFTKAQRLELESLSNELFGNGDYWRKVWKDNKVPDGTQEVEQKRYVRLRNGQVVTAWVAQQKGYIKDAGPDTEKTTKIVYRDANFDEMKHALLTTLETRRFSSMPPVQMLLTAATAYVQGKLFNLPFLVVKAGDSDNFDKLLELVPEDKRADLVDKKVPNSNPGLFCVDGVQFLSDVVFVSTQPEEAAKLLAEYEQSPKTVSAAP